MAPQGSHSLGAFNDGTLVPHVMFIPSAGMGHLLPFFPRYRRPLGPWCRHLRRDCPADSIATFPRIRRVEFHLLPFDASEFPSEDPFFLRWEALRRSAHLLRPLITGSVPRVSAVVTDVTLASYIIPISKEVQVPCHVLFISCATMLSLNTYVPVHLDKKKARTTDAAGGVGDVDIPGVRHIPQSWLPHPLLDLEKLFTKQFINNGHEITKADGFLISTFDALEPVALAALREGKVVPGFPPLYAIGPLMSHGTTATSEKGKTMGSSPVAWLDEQPARSVVYRSAVCSDQIREIAAGLEASGYLGCEDDHC